MDAEQRCALIDSLEAAFRGMDVDLYSGSQRLRRWIDKRYCYLEASQSREILDRLLAEIDDTDETADEMIALAAAAPTLMREFIRNSIRKTAEEIPSPAGRPRSLTPDKQRKIVAKMLRLIGQKVKTGIAQTRCAQEFGVSNRTVQDVWRKRDEIAAQPFQTMEDVWQFFSR